LGILDAMRRSLLVVLSSAVALSIAPVTAGAHDYWLVPNALYVARPPRTVTVSMFVGDGFVAEEEKPHETDRTERLELVTRAGRTSLGDVTQDDARPTLRITLRDEGGYLVVVHRNVARIELEAAKFDTYLKDEGLDAIIAERARRGESAKPGRERHVRFLKALIQAGDDHDDVFATDSGEALAIVPRQNPVFVSPGDELEVRLNHRGAPFAGSKLEAISRVGSDIRAATYVTDADGNARVTIDRRGTWLLRAVHMTRCEGCEDADWQSAWTTYTFGSAPSEPSDVIAPSMFLVAPSHIPEEATTPNRSDVPQLPPPRSGCACSATEGTTPHAGLRLLTLALVAAGAVIGRRLRRERPRHLAQLVGASAGSGAPHRL
jgi:MYXO-CTERM domain-containing protein